MKKRNGIDKERIGNIGNKVREIHNELNALASDLLSEKGAYDKIKVPLDGSTPTYITFTDSTSGVVDIREIYKDKNGFIILSCVDCYELDEEYCIDFRKISIEDKMTTIEVILDEID